MADLLDYKVRVLMIRESKECNIELYLSHLVKREKPTPEGGLFLNYAGDHLISHTLTRAVPSAQRGLTSVFGMGTGGTLVVNSPASFRKMRSSAIVHN